MSSPEERAQLLGEIKQALTDVREDVGVIKKEIMGNGTPGLKVQHATLRERVDSGFKLAKWVAGIASTIGTGLVLWWLTS